MSFKCDQKTSMHKRGENIFFILIIDKSRIFIDKTVYNMIGYDNCEL